MSESDLSNIEDLPEDEKRPESDAPPAEDAEAVAEEEDETEQVEEEETPEKLLSEDFISSVFVSEGGTLPEDFLEFDHSYGYDCKRYFNICIADKDTIVFASGNLIHFFNLVIKQLWFRRSAGGGGIGHITKHPSLPHLAVAENGNNPLIIIYEWPSMEIVCVLKEGTTRQYTHLDYSPDGKLLSSQGGDPDYMLTIWTWEKSRTMLRRKAYSQSVNNVMFSPYVPGQLSTGGTGHIKFWKIARTFTGLKLMGDLGRFGKTEMSDILGFLPLPDEKVVSGCEWGNMLVWDEGLIKVEVFRKNRQYCHTAAITQFEFDNGELTTVGMDGLIKFWYFETIDQADPPDDDRVIEVEPLYEFKIGSEDEPAQLMAMLKRVPDDPVDSNWITQDGNGGIWHVKLDVNAGKESHSQLLFCHAGPVLGIAASPYGTYLASIGKDGRITIYDYVKKKILIRKRYPGVEGCCILWLPINVDNSGNVLVASFEDGTIRVFVVTFHVLNELSMIQVSKPHRSAITTLTMNPRGTIIVTGGEDATVFIHVIAATREYILLTPLGYIDVPSAVTFINWNPIMSATALVCCRLGQFVEMDLPEEIRNPVTVSYKIKKVHTNQFTFKSVKSQIRRNIKLKEIEIRKNKKRDGKKEELAKLRAENPGLDIDEETFLEDSDTEEELEPLFFPEVPNPILFAMYTDHGTVWLSMGGFDSGYVYEYNLLTEGPVSCTMVADADDIEIHSYAYYHNMRYLVLGMHDGQVRVNRVNEDDFRDLSDYTLLAMHDNNNGRICKICFSCDQRFMFTCGDDGNVFSYKVNPEDGDYVFDTQTPVPSYDLPKLILPDDEEIDELSLEEIKKKEEYDRKMKVANARKAEVTKIIHKLSERFQRVLERNQKLAESQRLSPDELQIDPRITHAVYEIFKAEMDLLERKMAYKSAKSDVGLKKIFDYFIRVVEFVSISVLGIENKWSVSVFRNRHVLPEFAEIKNAVEVRIEWADAKGRLRERPITKAISQIIEKKVPRGEAFWKQLNVKENELERSLQVRRMMKNYMSRRRGVEAREEVWIEHRSNKPDPNVNHPFDMLAIELAQKSIGDYKLKSAEDYTVPQHLRVTTLKKYNQMLETRVKVFRIKSMFNRKVVDLRKEKLALIDETAGHYKELDILHREVGPLKTLKPRDIPTMNNDIELLDKEFILYPGDSVRRKLRRMQFEKKKKKRSQLLSRLVQSTETQIPIDPLFQGVRKSEFDPKPEVIDSTSTYKVLRSVPSMKFKAQSDMELEDLEKLASDDAVDTPWEVELRMLRAVEKRGQQERLCRLIAHKIDKFDLKVKAVADHKLAIEIKAKFIELHLLKLNQEMIILSKFEVREQFLSNKVLKRHGEKNHMISAISKLQGKIDSKNKVLAKLNERERELTATFMDAIIDSAFFKYLRKIYKKKYKPPKVKKDDEDSDSDSSSSDESSTDDEEDAKSIDSREIGPIKMDEAIRPDGCEVELYNLAFELRYQRHQVEISVAEIKKQNEVHFKELEIAQKHMKTIENMLCASKEDLEAFQRVKQQRLNEVDVLIILKLSALAHFVERNKLETLDNTLLFSKSLLLKLNSRELDLLKEMELHKENFKRNRRHLGRMKQDLEYMTEVTADLNSDISDNLIKKLGGVMTLDEVEEALLRRMVARLRSNADNYRRKQGKKLDWLNKTIASRSDCWRCAARCKTEKLNTLCALEKEKQSLTAKLALQDEYAQMSYDNPHMDENMKLLELVRQQVTQISELKEEIAALKHHTKPIPRPQKPRRLPPRPPPSHESGESEEEDEACLSELGLPTTSHDGEADQERPLPDLAESPEMYTQALLDEIIQGLAEDGGAEHWATLTRSLQEGISKLPFEDQARARQIINDIIDKLPSYSDLKPPTEVVSDDLPADIVTIVRGILDEILEDPIGIQKIVEDVVDRIVPVEEREDSDVKEMISTIIDEIHELRPSNDEIGAQELIDKVARSFESLAEPDIATVREMVNEIIKTSILEKLAVSMEELDASNMASGEQGDLDPARDDEDGVDTIAYEEDDEGQTDNLNKGYVNDDPDENEERPEDLPQLNRHLEAEDDAEPENNGEA